MTAMALLVELRQRGVELVPEGNCLRYRAPRGALTPELRAALAERKAELLACLSTEPSKGERQPDSPDFAPMSLDRFAQEGSPLEVKVPWLDTSLWFGGGRGAETCRGGGL